MVVSRKEKHSIGCALYALHGPDYSFFVVATHCSTGFRIGPCGCMLCAGMRGVTRRLVCRTFGACGPAFPGVRDDAKLERVERKGCRGLFEVVVSPESPTEVSTLPSPRGFGRCNRDLEPSRSRFGLEGRGENLRVEIKSSRSLSSREIAGS